MTTRTDTIDVTVVSVVYYVQTRLESFQDVVFISKAVALFKY